MVALCSLWLPFFLMVVEILGYGGLHGLEYFFIALSWPATVPLIFSLALLYRQAPFFSGVASVCLVGVVASEFLWTGLLGFTLGTNYWQSGSRGFFDVVMGVVRLVGICVVPSLPVYAGAGATAWLRRRGWIG